MGNKLKKLLIGSITAIICAVVLIYSMENDKSLKQIFLGFVFFILPFSFINVLFSRLISFIFVFASIMFGFLLTRYSYHDFWIGIVLAAVLGGAFYFSVTKPAVKKMGDYQPFSPNDYKDKATNFYKNNRN